MPQASHAPIPITPQVAAQIAHAKKAKKPIERGLMISGFNAWSLAIMAGLSALFALFSIVGLFVFVGLATAAVIEFRGRAKLKQLEDDGPKLLRLNQYIVAGLAAMYCGYQIYAAMTGAGIGARIAEIDPAAAEMLGDLPEMIQAITAVVYGVVLVGALIYQGLMAAYYTRLGKRLIEYRTQTPEWIALAQAA